MGKAAYRFGIAEQQNTLFDQTIVEQRNQLFLQFNPEINQQVSTGEDVQPSKWRVHDDVLGCKDNHVTNFFVDAIARPIGAKKMGKAFCRNINDTMGWVETNARQVNRILIDIRGKNLQSEPLLELVLCQGFFEGHGKGIGFFPRRAGRYPSPQCLARRITGQ